MTNKKELLYISFLCLICCVVFFTFGGKASVTQANLMAAAEEDIEGGEPDGNEGDWEDVPSADGQEEDLEQNLEADSMETIGFEDPSSEPEGKLEEELKEDDNLDLEKDSANETDDSEPVLDAARAEKVIAPAAAEEISVWQSKEVYMVLGVGIIMLVLILGMIVKELNS